MSTKIDMHISTDVEIVKMIGSFVRHHRLEQNKTQTQLAEEAGISRATLTEFEKGRQVKLLTLVQLLRVLGQLHVLGEFVIRTEPRPIQLAELELSKRKRASGRKTKRTRKSDW